MTKVMSAKQKQDAQKYSSKKLKMLMGSTALVAASLVAMASPAKAQSWDNWTETNNFTWTTNGVDTTDITTSASRAGGVSPDLDIPFGDTVNVHQPDSASMFYAKAADNADPTDILGSLWSNGQILITDRNGVFFGPNAVVDVTGIIASTADIDMTDFLNDTPLEFTNFGDLHPTDPNSKMGAVINEGTITVREAGLAAFVSPNVVNRGIINAKLGKVAFAAGNKVTVDLYGDGLLEIVDVEGKLDKARVVNANAGEINAEGGEVLMTARAASALVNNLVNLNGVADVTSATVADGRIILRGGNSGRVQVAGDVDTGNLSVAGDDILVRNDVDVDASGTTTLKADTIEIEGDITTNKAAILRRTDGVATLGSEVASTLSLTQAELDKITADELQIGNDDAAKSNITDINVGAVNLTGFNSVELNALAASSISFNDIVSFGNLVANADSIFVNAALSATGVNFNAVDGGAGVIQINDVMTTAGGDANFTTDSFTVGATGGVSTLGGAVNINTDAAQIDGGINAGNGAINLFRNTDGEISLGAVNAGLHLSQSELDNLQAGSLVVGNPNNGDSNTTDINVENADVSHIDSVDLNALAASSINFAGNNFFAALAASTDIINVLNGSVNATNSIHFDAPTVNLNGDLNAPAITGTATTVAVQSDDADIQDGVDVSANGSTISVAAGTYVENVVVSKDGITINGANAGVNPNTTGHGAASQVLPGLNAGFTVTGDSVTIDGFTVGNGLAGVDLSGSSNATVRNNIFSGGLWGAFGNGASSVSLLNNEIKNTTAQGVNFSFLTGTNQISGNVIDGNGISSGGVVITDSDSVTLSANTVEEVLNNAVVVSDSSNVSVTGNTLNGDDDHVAVDVNGGSNVSVTGNTIDDFETAVDMNGTTGTNSISGNTGTSVEYGVIANSVAGLSVVGNTFYGNSVTGIDVVDSAGVDIDGNFLYDFTTGISVKDSGSNARIRNNTIENDATTNLETGIVADNTANAWITNNDVNGASVVGILAKNTDGTNYANDLDIWKNRVTVTGDATGIRAENSDFVTIGSHGTSPGDTLGNGNVVSGGKDGIVVVGSTNAMVRYNTVSDVSEQGIDTSGNSHNAQILDNDVDNTGREGIISRGDFVTTSRNNVNTTGFHGIVSIFGNNNVVSDNVVANVTGSGIVMQDNLGTNNLIDNNTVDGTTGNGIGATRAAGLTISNNKLGQTAAIGARGIFVNDSDGVIVDTNTIDNTGSDGAEVINSTGADIKNNLVGLNGGVGNIGGEGIDLNNSENSFITDNQIKDTVSNGISLNPSSGSIVQGNTITDAGLYGIIALGNSTTTIDNLTIGGTGAGEKNVINNAGLDGIFLNWVGGTSTVSGNKINNSYDDGIQVNNSTGVTLSENKIDGSGTQNFFWNSGIQLFNADGTVIDQNVITNSYGHGVYMDESDGVHVTSNIIDGVTVAGGVDIDDSANVLVDGNEIYNVGHQAVYGFNVAGITVSNNFLGTDKLGADKGDNNIKRNGIHINNGVGGSITGNVIVDTALDGIEVINSPGVGLGDAFVISGNKVGTFDGTTAFGADNIGREGIDVNGSAWVQIIDNKVMETVSNGISLNPSPYATIQGNTVTNAGSHGIVSSNSDNVQIGGLNAGEENTVTDSGNVGIYVIGGENVNVDGNVINGGIRGIYASLTGDNLNIRENKIGQTTGTSSNSITVWRNAGTAMVDGNDIDNAGWDGIAIVEGTGFVTAQNNFIDNTVGASAIAVLNHTGDALIDTNTINGVDRLGIYVDRSDGLEIVNNNINDTGREAGWFTAGIHLEESDNTLVDGNTITNTNNGGVGIKIGAGNRSLVASTGNVISNNIINNTDGDGVEVDSSAGVKIEGNAIGYTDLAGTTSGGANNIKGEGVDVNGSDNAQILSNKITQTTSNGVSVNPSSFVTIDGNVIDNVDGHGVYVTGGTNNTVSGNFIGTNGGNNNIAQDGVHIDASDVVTIDSNVIKKTDDDGIEIRNLSGFTITRNNIDTTPSGGHDGIYGFNISNGTIGGSLAEQNVVNADDDGIRVDDASTVTISWNDVDTDKDEGIEVDTGSSNITIEWNTIHDTGDEGIEIDGSVANPTTNIKILNNTITNTDNDGIEVDGATDITITGNTIDTTGDQGINVDNNLGFLTVESNIISNTNDEGIKVTDSTAATIHNNDVTNAGTSGNDDGIFVEDVDGVRVTSNRVTKTSEDGIHVSSSDDALIQLNTVRDTAEHGIRVNPSHRARILDNTIYDAGIDGINVLDSDDVQIRRNTIQATAGSFTVFPTFSITSPKRGAGRDGIHVEGGVRAVITDNNVNAAAGFPFGGADGAGRDAIHVSSNEEVRILRNNVRASNSFLSSHEGANRFGIYVVNSFGGDGITVNNNNLFAAPGFPPGSIVNATGDDGIHIVNSAATNTGEFSTVNGNWMTGTGGDGIFVDGTANVRVRGNTVRNADDDGIDVQNSAGAVIAGGNDILNTRWNSIELTNSANSRVNDNIIDNTYRGNGIYVDNSAGTRVRRNLITDSFGPFVPFFGGHGIEVHNSADIRVTDNVINRTGAGGIDVRTSDDARIRRNTITNAGIDGIAVVDSADVLIDDNFIGTDALANDYGARNIRNDGIHVVRADNVKIENNTLTDVDDDGIKVQNSDNAEILANTLYSTKGRDSAGSQGIYVNPSDDVEIIGNIIDNTGDDGIQINGGTNALVQNNVVTDAGDDGLDVNNYNGTVTIDGNTFDNSDDDGLDIDTINGVKGRAIITGNTINDSGADGMDIDDVAHVEITGNNKVFDNNSDGIDVNNVWGTSSLIIDGNEVHGNGDNGVEVENTVNTEVTNNLIYNNGSRGLFMQGPNNDAVLVAGNTFGVTGDTTPIHAEFESGVIDLTGDTNIFNFGDTALRFAPAPIKRRTTAGPLFADMELVDDTIGAQFFNGQSTFFVELDNGAFFNPGTPTVLNALDSTYVTPFGTVTPAATGGFIGADVFAFLEQRFFHFVDRNDLGLFFFGEILSPELDQEDILRQFGAFDPLAGNVQFTVNGLPFVDPAFALANIAPAAGGEEGEGTTAEELAGLEPAAGGSEDAGCWADAVAAAETGVSVNYSFGFGGDEILSDAAGCSEGL